jgi:hypothetical protein
MSAGRLMSADYENERLVAHLESLRAQRLTWTSSAWAKQSVDIVASLIRTATSAAIAGRGERKEDFAVGWAIARHVLCESARQAKAANDAAQIAHTAAQASAVSMSDYAEHDLLVETATLVAASTALAGAAAQAALDVEVAFTSGCAGAAVLRLATCGKAAAEASVRAIATSVAATDAAVVATEWSYFRAWAENIDWVAHELAQYQDHDAEDGELGVHVDEVEAVVAAEDEHADPETEAVEADEDPGVEAAGAEGGDPNGGEGGSTGQGDLQNLAASTSSELSVPTHRRRRVRS